MTTVDIAFTNQQLFNSSTGGTISGDIQVDYTANTVTGTVTASLPNGTTPFTFTSFTFDPATNTVTLGNPPSLNGAIQTYDANGGGTLSWPVGTQQPSSVSATVAAPNTVVDNSGPGVTSGTLGANPTLPTTSSVVCFAAGTLIRTMSGDVAVEKLAIGDIVVTASGEQRPIVWLGHRKVVSASLPNPRDAWPVRIAADAFGAGKPSRDLYVSPAHSICVDCVGEVMIEAQLLVNGATITREPVDEIDYWHVELETHEVLLANDLPAESYLAMRNREFFVERAGASFRSDFGDADFCRPRANDGPVLAAVRAQLEARAALLGYARESDPSLRLVVDGVDVAPIGAEGVAVFLLPKSAQDVRLLSTTFVPSDDLGHNLDARRLGLCVQGLSLSDGRATTQIALSEPALAEGFFPEEGADGREWRWTRGELALPAGLFANFAGPQIVLNVAYEGKLPRGWRAPAASAVRQEASPAAPRLYAVN